MKLLIGLLTFWLASSACANEIGNILGTLETNEYKLQVLVGDTQLIYNVLSANGEIIAEQISREQLNEQWPLLGELADSGVADGAGLDAQHQQVPGTAEQSEFIDLR